MLFPELNPTTDLCQLDELQIEKKLSPDRLHESFNLHLLQLSFCQISRISTSINEQCSTYSPVARREHDRSCTVGFCENFDHRSLSWFSGSLYDPKRLARLVLKDFVHLYWIDFIKRVSPSSLTESVIKLSNYRKRYFKKQWQGSFRKFLPSMNDSIKICFLDRNIMRISLKRSNDPVFSDDNCQQRYY